jgi:2,4-diketo-3-deoxy-L-fuconate hydrolase
MAMRIARLDLKGAAQWAVESPEGLRALEGDYPTTRQLFENGGLEDAARAALSGALLPADTPFLSPVTQDARFICQASNYADHVREVGGDPAQIVNNVIFTKASSSISPPMVDIIRPPHVRLLDYEVELGLVLRRGFNSPVHITEANLVEWVGGLVIVNDVTARDVQISHMQFHKSKSYRTFGPVGPWLVVPTAQDLARWPELILRLDVDGEVRQNGPASEMIFKPAETLAELSTIMDLDAGDLIATGTPGGVALHPPSATIQALAGFLSPKTRFGMFLKGQMKRHQYLRSGQTMTTSIRTHDGTIDLGHQRNRVVGSSQ